MKKLFTIFAAVLLTASVFAQSPEKMSYQAVVRNSSNALITNAQIGMEINIREGSLTGTIVYTETQTPTTNANGLVSIEIGGGAGFNTIDWSAGPYFIETKTAVVPPLTTYTITTTSRLLSVPYALHAKSAEIVTGEITEIDPAFTANFDFSDAANGDLLQFNGTKWVKLTPSYLTSYTETQSLSDVITISNSANAQIKKVTDPTDAQDAATKAYVDAVRIMVLDLQAQMGVTDTRDGNHYNAVRIGNQVWMAENLAYLPGVAGPGTGSSTTPYYYVYGYNGTDVNAAKTTANYTTYGVLYNWPAAMHGAASSTANPSGVQGICPDGWHLPSNAEWTQLENYLADNGYNYDGTTGGGIDKIAKAMASSSGWSSHSGTGTVGNTDFATYRNKSGFTALPGGGRKHDGTFYNIGDHGYWWGATQDLSVSAFYRILRYDYGHVTVFPVDKEFGFSVRCVRD